VPASPSMKIVADIIASPNPKDRSRSRANQRFQRRRGRMSERAIMGGVFRPNARHGQGGKMRVRRALG
jgi:hypothetical protein